MHMGSSRPEAARKARGVVWVTGVPGGAWAKRGSQEEGWWCCSEAAGLG